MSHFSKLSLGELLRERDMLGGRYMWLIAQHAELCIALNEHLSYRIRNQLGEEILSTEKRMSRLGRVISQLDKYILERKNHAD